MLSLSRLFLIPALALAGATASQERPSCCFTNPSFTGVCKVEPAEDESCASILAYLNNPQSGGKSYCAGARIRGGWKQVECEGSSSAEGKSTAEAQRSQSSDRAH